MKRPWVVFAAYLVAVALLMSAMALVTVIGVRLDRDQQFAESRAALEERVRLVLWRMDSAVGPIVAQENARPYFEYAPFYPAERAYTNMFAPLAAGEVLVPSPLLTLESPYIRIHFQYAPDGTLTSPNVPESNMRDLAETGFVTHENIVRSRVSFEKMRAAVTYEFLRQSLANQSVSLDSDLNLATTDDAIQSSEYQQRAKTIQQSITNQALTNNVMRVDELENKRSSDVTMPVMNPVWSDNELFLTRAAQVDGETYLQGCWLNWPAIRTDLLDSISDLLPSASLTPISETNAPEESRRLASAPIHLAIDEPSFVSAILSPLRIALLIAWVCVIMVIVAIGGLLWGATALSERRAAFVSAVTHELRTPLTTFQLYSDLLAENRVPDQERRNEYYQTLRNEATRLRHLVDNVLAFARLERAPTHPPKESVSVADLVARIRPGIDAQCNRAEMTLDWDIPPEPEITLNTNAEIVEQILANLVDNACKYANGSEHNQIEIASRSDTKSLIITVRDFGPGLTRDAARTLYRPFAKSASEAAVTAPGVGLGLALSRRLAHSLGGDLRWRNHIEPGCCFELSLPI